MRNSPDDPPCPSAWPALTCIYLGAPHPGTALRRLCSPPGRYRSAAREPPWCSWRRASSPHGQQHMGPPLGTEVVRQTGDKEKVRETVGQPPQAFQSGMQGVRMANLSNNCRCLSILQHRYRWGFQWRPVCSWEGWQPLSLSALSCPQSPHHRLGSLTWHWDHTSWDTEG